MFNSFHFQPWKSGDQNTGSPVQTVKDNSASVAHCGEAELAASPSRALLRKPKDKTAPWA